MIKILSYLYMLKAEYAIQFDIFAVDDGIIETLWGTTFDLYRLQYESLFPKGIKSLAESAKRMEMDFGWESQGDDYYGNSWVFRLALSEAMVGKSLTAKLAW